MLPRSIERGIRTPLSPAPPPFSCLDLIRFEGAASLPNASSVERVKLKGALGTLAEIMSLPSVFPSRRENLEKLVIFHEGAEKENYTYFNIAIARTRYIYI